MSNENTPSNKTGQSLDPAAHNAEIARKVKDQDISGKPTATGEFGEATEALDKLAAQVTPKPDPVPDPAKAAEEAEAKKKAAAASTAAAAPDPAGKKADAVQPSPEDKEKADREAQALKRAEELFKGSPSLPPNASPKSAEAFAAIKIKAASELSAREQEIEALKKQLEEAKKPSPEQLQKEKELEDHRQWRLKMDVDFDPKFKEFDKQIEQSREFIYAQLAKSPVITKEVLDKIKSFGGPDKVDMTKIFESVKDGTLQRLVEAKIADIEVSKYNKEQAVNAAKSNLGKYIETRQAEVAQMSQASRKATEASLSQMLGSLDWFSEKKADSAADDAAKKDIADHNKFVTELKQQIEAAKNDDTPEMRAILITGMAQLFNLQRRLPALEAALSAKTKELEEIKTKWEAVKSSTRSRLQESQAPAGGMPAAKPGLDVNQRSADALDDIARRVMEEKARAAQGS